MNASDPALVFLNGIGDHFINLPAIRATAELFPGKLRVICRAGSAELFSDLPTDLIHEIHWGLDQRDQVLASDYVADLLNACDLLVSLNPWHTDAVDRMLDRIRPARSVGFFPAFTTHVPLNFDKHSAELAYDVPRALGSSVPITQHSGPPRLPAWAASAAAHLIEVLPPRSRILVIHPETLKEKMWCLSRFRLFIDAFLDTHPEYFVFTVGITDLKLDGGRHSERVVPCHGLPFFASAALVASADVFVGVDSCMLHVADLFRVPSVGLFGPTNPAEFGFRLTELHRYVTGNGDMDGIEAPEVISAVDSLERVAASANLHRKRLSVSTKR